MSGGVVNVGYKMAFTIFLKPVSLGRPPDLAGGSHALTTFHTPLLKILHNL